jgi:hypothetical protein
MCGKKMEVSVPKGWDYKQVTVRCGNTSPSGYPWLCAKCEVTHAGRDWRREAAENGERWDEDDW